MITRVVAAVAGVLLAVVASNVLNAPVPRRGLAVGDQHYRVNVGALKGHEDWRSASDGVHAAAEQLANTFVRSSMDAPLANFLEESAQSQSSKILQVSNHVKRHLFWGLQKYLGWSMQDASGFLRMATLYVASEQQLSTLVAPLASSKDSVLEPQTLLDIGSGTYVEECRERERERARARGREQITRAKKAIARRERDQGKATHRIIVLTRALLCCSPS